MSRRLTRVPEAAAGGGTRAAATTNTLGLSILGLTAGDRVRFRSLAARRWREGVVVCRERDGSVGVTDDKGAARAIRVEWIEVARTGPRGGSGWEPVTARVARTKQLPLL